jgi:hypothetical protein
LNALLVLAVLAAGPDAGAVKPDAGVDDDDAVEPSDAGEAADAVIEEFTPSAPAPSVESFAVPAPGGMTAHVYGHVEGWTSLDTRFDSPPGVDMAENVAELRLRAALGIDLKVNDYIRVVLEGRAQFRGVTQRDFGRTKGFFEPMLGDAYVDVYTKKVDIRVGNQRIALGANAGLAPADQLNPRDLRESFLSGQPEDALLPVFGIRAMGEIGKVSITAAYVPFFEPDRYFVFGQDEALIQPASEQTIQNTRIDPSIEDYIQNSILSTKRPVPFAGDIALRAVSTGDLKIGASWVWMNEKLPQVTLDSELSALMRQMQMGQSVDPALASSVLNRFQAGQQLYTGIYDRQHVFSLEGSRIIGPGQLDVDVAFSPRQTFFDASFAPISKAALTWVLGYTQASDSPLLYGVNYLGMAIPDVKAHEQIFLIEPATAVGADRIAWFHLFAGYVSYQFWHKRFEASLRAAFEVVQKSFAVAPSVTWLGVDGLRLWVAAEFYEGNPYSAFGYFGRNNKVLLGARWDLF